MPSSEIEPKALTPEEYAEIKKVHAEDEASRFQADYGTEAHAHRGKLIAAIEATIKFMSSDCGIEIGEEIAFMQGNGPDPLHKECRVEIEAFKAEQHRLRSVLETISVLVRRDLKPEPELKHQEWDKAGSSSKIGAEAITLARKTLKTVGAPVDICDDTEKVLSSLPENHYIKITVEEGLLTACIIEEPPEDGWPNVQENHVYDDIARVGINMVPGTGPEPFFTRVVELLRRYVKVQRYRGRAT